MGERRRRCCRRTRPSPGARLSLRCKEPPMDFALTDEQQLIIKTTRDFVREELVPH